MQLTIYVNNYSRYVKLLWIGRRKAINKKAVFAAATIVFTLGLSSSNVSTAESPAAQVIEEERPVTLYFPYTETRESLIAAAENEEAAAAPVFYGETQEVSLKPKETISEAIALETNSMEQTASGITEKELCAENVKLQAESISLRQREGFTDAEKEMIAKVVYAEARGECFDGRVAVAQVVINRYQSGKYGPTLKRVIYKRYQFAVSKKYTAPCMEAVEYAIENMPYPEDMYYFRVSKSKHWRNFVYYNRIGNHSFYCGKKRIQG